jgi:hypothetical protein
LAMRDAEVQNIYRGFLNLAACATSGSQRALMFLAVRAGGVVAQESSSSNFVRRGRRQRSHRFPPWWHRQRACPLLGNIGSFDVQMSLCRRGWWMSRQWPRAGCGDPGRRPWKAMQRQLYGVGMWIVLAWVQTLSGWQWGNQLNRATGCQFVRRCVAQRSSGKSERRLRVVDEVALDVDLFGMSNTTSGACFRGCMLLHLCGRVPFLLLP